MFLLLESGATKLHYVLADAQQVYYSDRIPGLHPFLTTAASWQQALGRIAQAISTFPAPISCHYYGTGCGTQRGRAQVQQYFAHYWPATAQVTVADDLTAAARSLYGRQAGLVGILGTGSNAAYYDGQQLVARAGGLGYLLGDEGGGASLGRSLLRAFFQDRLPADLRHDLLRHHQLDRETVIPALYSGEAPSRLLASFAPWLHGQQTHPFIQVLLRHDFEQFIRLYVQPLAKKFGQDRLALTGSIAEHFGDLLRTIGMELGLKTLQTVADPAAGLLAYHQQTMANPD